MEISGFRKSFRASPSQTIKERKGRNEGMKFSQTTMQKGEKFLMEMQYSGGI